MNFLLSLYARIDNLFSVTVTTSSAIQGLEKALANLEKAITHHSDQAEVHAFLAEQAQADADTHAYASARAERIRDKLMALLG